MSRRSSVSRVRENRTHGLKGDEGNGPERAPRLQLPMILILGGTGRVGRRLVRKLRAGGYPVRPTSRTGEVRFDWEQPGTWDAVLQGATKAFVMAPNRIPDPAFVQRAVTLGVEHIMLLSSRGIDVVGDERLMAAERAVETSARWPTPKHSASSRATSGTRCGTEAPTRTTSPLRRPSGRRVRRPNPRWRHSARSEPRAITRRPTRSSR